MYEIFWGTVKFEYAMANRCYEIIVNFLGCGNDIVVIRKCVFSC